MLYLERFAIDEMTFKVTESHMVRPKELRVRTPKVLLRYSMGLSCLSKELVFNPTT